MAKKAASKGSETKKLRRVVLLDSHAILHRAYHAMPDFNTSKGSPTGALYGLVSMLLRVNDFLDPDYLIACRDMPGKTHRHEKFAEYKGHRQEIDEALVDQLKRAPEVFKAFGIPTYGLEGYEADDCLGTIVKELSEREDVETVIASGDMDMLQLINESVKVYTMRKGINDTVLFDSNAVKERYGFGPESVVDYKALRGDPSDNIPGVKGIGEKTATELLQAFGSLENIYQLIETEPEAFKEAGIKPRIVELLRTQEKEARFSQDLATISKDAPIDFKLPESEWRIADHLESIAALCDELEFRSLKERVRGAAVVQSAWKDGDLGSSGEIDEIFPKREIDADALAETSVALWILRSDLTNPSLEDILASQHTNDFEEARVSIFKQLDGAGRSREVFEKIEKPVIPVARAMKAAGIMVDREALSGLSKEYSARLAEIERRIYQLAGREFNVGSPKQLAAVLYDELGLSAAKAKKTAGGARTTREEELLKLKGEHEIVADILSYRELQKLLSTYIDKIPDLVGPDSRLRATFVQAGTTTGRMASENPNLQNIPVKTDSGRRIRSAFVASAGNALVAIDYSQIELRIAAGLSRDPQLVGIFKSGGDVHAAVASQVFHVAPADVTREMRRRAKIINFGIIYGMGANALKANLGAEVTRSEAATFLEEYFKNFSGLAAFLEDTKMEAKRRGYTETAFGRRRYFAGFKSSMPGVVAQAERMAMNAPIQGTQADIIKLAMGHADALIERNGWRESAKLLLQVHDELVYEIEASNAGEIAAALKKAMEDAAPSELLSGVPILAEAKSGLNWGEMAPLA